MPAIPLGLWPSLSQACVPAWSSMVKCSPLYKFISFDRKPCLNISLRNSKACLLLWEGSGEAGTQDSQCRQAYDPGTARVAEWGGKEAAPHRAHVLYVLYGAAPLPPHPAEGTARSEPHCGLTLPPQQKTWCSVQRASPWTDVLPLREHIKVLPVQL